MKARIIPNTLTTPENAKKHRMPEHSKHGIAYYIRIGSKSQAKIAIPDDKDGKEHMKS